MIAPVIEFAIFNELSVPSIAADKAQAVHALIGLLNVMKEAARLGFRQLRTRDDFWQIELSPGLTISSASRELDHDGKTLIYSIFQSPYLNKPYEDEFLLRTIKKLADQDCASAEGFLSAHVAQSIAVSFSGQER